MIQLIHGDCLIESDKIESGSVDLILTDLPYGNMNTDGGRKLGINGWDFIIEPKQVYEIANRILRANGALCLFSQGPYTQKLITETHGNLPYSYRYTWLKDNFANPLGCKKAPVNYTEDVCVFFKKHACKNTNPLGEIVELAQKESGCWWNGSLALEYVSRGWSKSTGNARALLMHFLNKEYVQFHAPSELQYGRVTQFLNLPPLSEMRAIDATHKAKTPKTFNLPEGQKYKSNVLEYRKDYRGEHPTQKPVALIEDLIKTYTNEGDTVLDFCFGSGTTGVACKNLNRDFIGIEKDEKYFEIAKNRIEKDYLT